MRTADVMAPAAQLSLDLGADNGMPARREAACSPASRARSAWRREEAVRLYAEGHGERRIAAKLGVSKRQVGRYLHGAGVEIREWRVQPRACEGCGVEFTPRRSEFRFCSRACWYESNRLYPKPEARRCPTCDLVFVPEKPAYGRQHFCSLPCYWTSEALAEVTARRLAELHGDPTWNARWALARHRSTRLFGQLGAEGGAKGGRPTTLTPLQQQAILLLDKQGKSSRDIAEQLLHDRRLYLRVQRFLAHARSDLAGS